MAYREEWLNRGAGNESAGVTSAQRRSRAEVEQVKVSKTKRIQRILKHNRRASPVSDNGGKNMATLAETISTALRAVGSTTENRLRDVVADFDSMNLSGEERLSAVTTTIAALAATH